MSDKMDFDYFGEGFDGLAQYLLAFDMIFDEQEETDESDWAYEENSDENADNIE